MNSEIQSALTRNHEQPDERLTDLHRSISYTRACIVDDRVIWSGDWKQDFKTYLLNTHELFGIYWAHRLDPFTKKKRCVALLCSFMLAIFVTALRYEINHNTGPGVSIVISLVTYTISGLGFLIGMGLEKLLVKANQKYVLPAAFVASLLLFCVGVYWITAINDRYSIYEEKPDGCYDILQCALDAWLLSVFSEWFLWGLLLPIPKFWWLHRSEQNKIDESSKKDAESFWRNKNYGDLDQQLVSEFVQIRPELTFGKKPIPEDPHKWEDNPQIRALKKFGIPTKCCCFFPRRAGVSVLAALFFITVLITVSQVQVVFQAEYANYAFQAVFAAIGMFGIYSWNVFLVRLYAFWLITILFIDFVYLLASTSLLSSICSDFIDAELLTENQCYQMLYQYVIVYLIFMIRDLYYAYVTVAFYNWMLDNIPDLLKTSPTAPNNDEENGQVCVPPPLPPVPMVNNNVPEAADVGYPVKPTGPHPLGVMGVGHAAPVGGGVYAPVNGNGAHLNVDNKFVVDDSPALCSTAEITMEASAATNNIGGGAPSLQEKYMVICPSGVNAFSDMNAHSATPNCLPHGAIFEGYGHTIDRNEVMWVRLSDGLFTPSQQNNVVTFIKLLDVQAHYTIVYPHGVLFRNSPNLEAKNVNTAPYMSQWSVIAEFGEWILVSDLNLWLPTVVNGTAVVKKNIVDDSPA